MKKKNAKGKAILIYVVKDDNTIADTVRPEMRVEDILLGNGLAGGRLGPLTKGPFFQDRMKLFKEIYPGQTLFCLFHVD